MGPRTFSLIFGLAVTPSFRVNVEPSRPISFGGRSSQIALQCTLFRNPKINRGLGVRLSRDQVHSCGRSFPLDRPTPVGGEALTRHSLSGETDSNPSLRFNGTQNTKQTIPKPPNY